MNVHEGHRERLRDRFREHGLDSFNELNALELILFFAIPRRDTNPIAHELLDHFGSLQAVLMATEQELCAVPGIGMQAATLLRLIPQMMRKCETSRAANIKTISSTAEAVEYLKPRFLYEQEEVVLLLCLDSQRRVTACAEVGRGVVNATETSLRRIVETALKYKAVSAILSHNHPDGRATPSVEDDHMTRQVINSLALVGVSLTDHIIIAQDGYASFKRCGMLTRY